MSISQIHPETIVRNSAVRHLRGHFPGLTAGCAFRIYPLAQRDPGIIFQNGLSNGAFVGPEAAGGMGFAPDRHS